MGRTTRSFSVLGFGLRPPIRTSLERSYPRWRQEEYSGGGGGRQARQGLAKTRLLACGGFLRAWRRIGDFCPVPLDSGQGGRYTPSDNQGMTRFGGPT